MRSGRGKCPQCKETIVVDLDAAEIRCPYCNALLKKSKKTVAEVRAEEEARIAAAEARERALRGEPEEVAAEPAPEPIAEPVAEVPAEPVAESVAEPVPETPVEEAAPETPAEEVAEAPAEEPVDEIGMTDEELAAMDETLPTEESAPAEEAAEPVDEIGLSDEELAALDDVPAAEDATSEEPIDIPADSGNSDDLSVTAGVAMEDETAEESAEDALTDEDVAALDDIPALSESEDAPAQGAAAPYVPSEEPADEADIPVETTDEESADEADAPVEEAADAPVEAEEDVIIPEEAEEESEMIPEEAEVEAPVEVAPAEEIPEEAVEVEPEEPAEVEAPAEEVAPAEEAPAEEAAYTDEDMAFAASLSDGIDAGDKDKGAKKVGYVAPVVNTKPADRGDKADAPAKSDASKGEKKMSDSAIYKKPIAVIMMILAFIGAAVSLLFINLNVFGYVSESVETKVAELILKLPTAIVEKSLLIFGGIVVLISLLGLTGTRGKPGFFFALLAGLVYTAVQFFGGAAPVVEVEMITKILAEYGEYVTYAIYGLLFLAAIFFAVSIGSGKEELEISGGTVVLPILYMLLTVVGAVALVILPKVMDSFVVTEDIIKYAIYGVVGLSILLTLIGVHSNTASRGANAWLLFAAAMIVALLFGALVLVDKLIPAEKALDVLPAYQIFTAVTPCIIFFPLIGYTISDLRN